MATAKTRAFPEGGEDRRISPEVWAVAIVLVIGTIMTILDTTIVNVALDPLARDLHSQLSEIQWVVTSYLLAIAVVIPLSGWLTRRFGAKDVYLVSMVLFTLGSLLCGLARSAPELIAFRAIQGLGGGAIAPVGQMILVNVAGPRKLPRVMSAFGVPTILAPVFGPTLGGLLLVYAGWRWIFFVNLPIGVVAVALARRRLPVEERQQAGRVDLPGVILAALGLIGITYGLAEVPASDDKLLNGALPICAGAVLVAGFVLRSLHVQRPLLDMRLFRGKVFVAASVATFSLGGALTGNSVLAPLFLQTVANQSALHAGLLVAPRGLGATLGTWLSGRLMERIGTGGTAVTGTALVGIFTVPYLFLRGDTSVAYFVTVGALQGIGIGMSIMPAMTAAYRSLRPEQVADATPQQNILMRVGASVSTAILIGVLQTGLITAGSEASRQARAFDHTFGWLVGITAVAVLAAVFLVRIEHADLASRDWP
jgi:EmrB/QacA subfamily drug resistance transporter